MGAEVTKSDDLLVGGSLMHSEEREPDFSGWATKAGLKCTDGRTIMPDAFKHQDKAIVPLVWQHCHDEPTNVLGHVVLDNREDGVYAYGYFNGTETGNHAKTLVEHGDISSLSIFANKLVEKASNVIHGVIREVSLVMAGANPGAVIDNLSVQHADGESVELEDEAIIHTGLDLEHEGLDTGDDDDDDDDDLEHADGPTVQDVYNSMTDEQKGVVNYMVGAALESKKGSAEHSAGDDDDSNGKGGLRMSRNVFEEKKGKKDDTPAEHSLSHDDMKLIAADAVRRGSLKEAVEDYALKHGIDNIDILFPDARNVTNTPEWDKRRTEWVAGVLSGTKHSPFSRIKSIVADITHDEARARGYIKGSLKKEEFFGLVSRVTTPSTVYKKQKLDRDDIIDITDFDVVMWLKGEMRLMLDEEIATACLIGDGRDVMDEDKIKDPAGANEGAGIRSIAEDDDLYAASVFVNYNGTIATTAIVDEILNAMQFYKGTGSPTLYTTRKVVTQCLLLRDTQGRRYYRTKSDLAAEIGVADIVEVETMERRPDIIGIIVNLADYTFGTDRGGETSFFDDFDIDYNQYKYLYETRLSGALTKIRSAIVLKEAAGASPTLVTPTVPSFVEATGVITIPTQTGTVYRRADTNAVVAGGALAAIAAGTSLTITAEPASTSYYFANNVQDEWTFERPAA